MMEFNTKTTIRYVSTGLTALGEYFPPKTVEMTMDCTEATADNFLEFFKSYLLATGYAEESFYRSCREISDEYFYHKDEEEKSSRRNGHRLGETGIDSNNFTFTLGSDPEGNH